jgi:hypothetical protein
VHGTIAPARLNSLGKIFFRAAYHVVFNKLSHIRLNIYFCLGERAYKEVFPAPERQLQHQGKATHNDDQSCCFHD